MSRRLFIFQKSANFKAGNPVFTHYWENEGQNFFDSVTQSHDVFGHITEKENTDFVSSYEPLLSVGPTEAYLDQFRSKDDEGNETGYTWVELESSRYQRETITTIKVEMTVEDFDQAPVLFFKLVDWDDEKGIRKGLPLYYYSTNVTQVSDQNYDTTSYSVECTLDMWATIWVYMHSAMKGCSEELKWSRKMADRFIFSNQDNWDPINLTTKDGSEGYGFWIDYLDQPYLLRTNEWQSNLIAADERDNVLSLDDWLYINSSEKQKGIFKDAWLEDIWLPWVSNQWCGMYFTKEQNPYVYEQTAIENTTAELEDCYKKVNYYAFPIRDNSFDDSLYNSNSKYRYLVCKTGNNTWPVTSTEEGANKSKGVMFQNQSCITRDIVPVSSTLTDKVSFSTDINNWNKERNNLTFYKDIKINNTKFDDLTQKFIVSFENYIFNKKYFKLQIIYDDFKKSYIFTNGLDSVLSFILVDGKQKNKFYELVKLPAKSFVYNIKGNGSDLIPSLGLVFKDDGVYFRFKCRLDLNIGDISYQDIMKINMSFVTVDGLTLNSAKIFSDVAAIGDANTQRKINGESLVIIPIKKGEDEQLYLQYLNNPDNSGITMGDGSVLGMVINDIPPSVLAAALRTFADRCTTQPFGDTVSVRNGKNYDRCPISILNLSLNYIDGQVEGKNVKMSNYEAPVLFSEFDYIPVCVATSPNKEGIYSVIGGNNFFNYLYDILTNDSLTKENTKNVEPLLYGPAFWKWTYFIDGQNKIELTADLLDLKKMITEDSWNIYLNVNMTDTTHYFLDFTDLKNSKYPMTKIGMEFISGDSTNFPFTTEPYTHWLQNNQWSKEGSKNQMEIQNKYAKTQATINAAVAPIAGVAEGTVSGFKSGLGAAGAAVGAAGGLISGGIKSLTTMLGVNNAIKQANEEWNNKWRTDLGNMYSSPSYLVNSGFNSGSVIYSPSVGSLQSSYELFKTYRLPDQYRDLVWHDIATNGYMYMSECPYYTYNNRVKFNVVNCSVDDKAYTITNYLRLKMFEISPLLSQQDSIATFFDKCKNMFRVFKDVYDPENLEELIKGNIEIERLWYKPYYGSALFSKVELGASYFESQLSDDWVSWPNNYSFDNTNNIYNTKNGLSGKVSIQVPYSQLGKYNSYAEICNDFEFLTVDNKDSYCAELDGDFTLYEKVNNLEYSEQKGISFDNYVLNTPVEYHNIQDWGTFGWLLKATKGEDSWNSTYYENGWKITLDADDNNKKFNLEFEPYSRFNFENPLYTIDDTWEIINNWKDTTLNLTENMFDNQKTWFNVLGKENAKWSFTLYEKIPLSFGTYLKMAGMAIYGTTREYYQTPHEMDNYRNHIYSRASYAVFERDLNRIEFWLKPDYNDATTICSSIPEKILTDYNYVTLKQNETLSFNFYEEDQSVQKGTLGQLLNQWNPQLNITPTVYSETKIQVTKGLPIGTRLTVAIDWFGQNDVGKTYWWWKDNERIKSMDAAGSGQVKGTCEGEFGGYRMTFIVKTSEDTWDLKVKYIYAFVSSGQIRGPGAWWVEGRWCEISKVENRLCELSIHIEDKRLGSWTMSNQLNNIIFVSKNSTPEENRIINVSLRNKKEG